MTQHPTPFMPLLSAIAASDFEKLVQMREISQWKETLAMLIAYVDDPEDWSRLCDCLGLTLYKSGDFHGASVCFICSGNVEKAVGVWSGEQSSPGLQTMQEIIEKAFVLSFALPQHSSSQSLSNLVHNYAQILASYGETQGALEYLDMVPGEPSENIRILKDRIYGSGLAGEGAGFVDQSVQKMSFQSWMTSPEQVNYPPAAQTPTPAPDFGESTAFRYYQPTEQSPAQHYANQYSPQDTHTFQPPGQHYGNQYPPQDTHTSTFQPPGQHYANQYSPQETQTSTFQPPAVQQFTPMPSMFTPPTPVDYSQRQPSGEGKVFQPVEPPSQFGVPPPTGTQMRQPTVGTGPPQGGFAPTPAPQGSFMPTPGAGPSPMAARPHVFNPVTPGMSKKQQNYVLSKFYA